MGIRGWIWLFLLVYLVHDLEEIFTVEEWMNRHRRVLRKLAANDRFLERVVKSVDLSTGQFAVAFAFLFIVSGVACWAATYDLRPGLGIWCFMAVVGVMFVHVFTHVGQALYLRMYTPGVITAVAVVLPYTTYIYVEMFRLHLINTSTAVLTAIAGVAVIVPLTLFSHFLGRKLIRRERM